MQDFFEQAIKANQEIYAILQNGLKDEFFQPVKKGAGGDISTRIDLIAEEIFIEKLSSFGQILSEEAGLVGEENEYQIIIDPLDGSENFISQFPYFGTSVAIQKGTETLGAIIVNLANGDIFLKEKSELKIAKIDSCIFENIIKNSYAKLGIFERSYCSNHVAQKLKQNKIKYRSPGAFALSLAYAHNVEFVIYEGKMRVYDIAAGLYMCEDLYTLEREDLLLVSKDKEIFDKISKFI
jgi:myo-inositol-1(or 4)-monophosphatase